MNITADNLIAKCQRNIPDLGQRVENSDWYFYFTEAIRKARAGRTFPWQRRTITKEFFTDIFEYILPDDFDSFIKPHKDMFEKSDESQFLLYGRDKDFFANRNYSLAVKWERDVKTLLAKQDSASMVLMDSFNDDATEYDPQGDASNASIDNVYYKEGTGSLRFDIADSTNLSTLPRLLDTQIDLTEYLNKGYAFLWVYMPTVITSLSLRYGTDASNYYSIATVTTDFYGNNFQTGWNLVQFDMKNATIVGSPDISAIDYYNILIDNTGVTDTDFRIDALTFHIPSLLELPYNTNKVVKDNTGVYKESVTAGNDTILMDETFEAAIMYEAIESAAKFKIRDADLIALAGDEKKQRYIDLNRRYPSVEAPVQSNYYSRFNKI